MKLAKKMLASALALAMVAALALTAFAAAPVFTTTATDAVVGETVTITVGATNMVGLEAADVIFNYDAEALEFVKVTGSSEAEYSLTAGGNPEAGKATFSFAFLESATADSAFAVLTFKVLKAGATDVNVSLKSWDGTAEKPAAVAVTVEAVEPVVETTAPVVDDTTAPVVDDTTAPVVDDTTAPVVDDTTAPVVDDTTAPVVDDTTVVVDETTVAPSTTSAGITQTGEAGVAAIAGVMALAAVAFVATRKKDEE